MKCEYGHEMDSEGYCDACAKINADANYENHE